MMLQLRERTESREGQKKKERKGKKRKKNFGVRREKRKTVVVVELLLSVFYSK